MEIRTGCRVPAIVVTWVMMAVIFMDEAQAFNSHVGPRALPKTPAFTIESLGRAPSTPNVQRGARTLMQSQHGNELNKVRWQDLGSMVVIPK